MTGKLTLAVIVLAAVSLLVLVVTRPHNGRAPGPARHGSPPPARTASPAPPAPSPSAPAAAALVVTAGQATGLLPFTTAQLADAATMAARFAATYATYRWNEPPPTYTNRLIGIATAQLRPVLARAATDPAVLDHRTREHAVSTGSATVQAIRALGPGSVTFLVSAVEHLSTDHGPRTETTRYAITTTHTRSDTSPDSRPGTSRDSPGHDGEDEGRDSQDTDGWRVDAIELATTGDTGDTPAGGTP